MMEPSSFGRCTGIFDRLSEISASDTQGNEGGRRGKQSVGFVLEVGRDYSAVGSGYSDTFGTSATITDAAHDFTQQKFHFGSQSTDCQLKQCAMSQYPAPTAS